MTKKIVAIVMSFILLSMSNPTKVVRGDAVAGGSGGISIDAKTDRNKAIVTLSKSGGVTNCPVFT